MKFTKFFLITLFSIIGFSQISGQNVPKDYFHNPLKINMVLSGTFAELRSNHFHSGIDIKTNGTTGLGVFASAPGYVSRINISPFGYGKAIYISHPNGYTTVYAHLDHFNKEIDSIIKAEQYSRERFELNFFPPKGLIKIERGELIAYSGNSGGSGGPHLHFEIRDGAERPMNPLNFGIEIPDNIKPTIQGIRIYNFINNQSVGYKEFKDYKGSTGLKTSDTIHTASQIYIGINTIDKLNGASNHNGVYSVIIKLDSQLVYKTEANRIVFSEKRYINAFLDFGTYYKQNTRYQISRILPANRLSIYQTVSNNGIIDLRDKKAHLINIEVSDIKGNTSKESFYVKGNEDIIESPVDEANLFFDRDNKFIIPEATVSIPKGCLYENIHFNMKAKENKSSYYSPIIEMGNPEIPLHSYVTLSIKPDSNLTENLYSKAALASLTKTNSIYYEGGSYSNGFVSTKTRSFGSYFIVVDTIAPRIKALNIYNGKTLKAQNKVEFIITDDLSGIEVYKGLVNGKWVLGDYDAKRNLLSFEIDEHWPKGNLSFVLILQDDKKNTAKATYKLIR